MNDTQIKAVAVIVVASSVMLWFHFSSELGVFILGILIGLILKSE